MSIGWTPDAVAAAEVNGQMSDDRVDVLIIAALPVEFEAAKAAGQATLPGRPGVAAWNPCAAGTSAPYLRGEYRTGNGRMWSVALARPTTMGGRPTASITTTLVERLKPRCLAMCGVCAGNPSETALGDVVVAEMAYAWDEGRYTPDGFEPAHQHLPLDPVWLRMAQEFDPSDLPSFGEASEEEARLWLLERLHRGQDPHDHPARKLYFPTGSWGSLLQRWEAEGLISRDRAQAVELTTAGNALIRRRLYDDADGPTRLPFRLLVGPMASGSAVIKDPSIWPLLKTAGVRKIAAVEMEAATIATIARESPVTHWLVAKGVMDHADIKKDDRYKSFAAKASAEVLFTLLAKLMPPTPRRAKTAIWLWVALAIVVLSLVAQGSVAHEIGFGPFKVRIVSDKPKTPGVGQPTTSAVTPSPQSSVPSPTPTNSPPSAAATSPTTAPLTGTPPPPTPPRQSAVSTACTNLRAAALSEEDALFKLYNAVDVRDGVIVGPKPGYDEAHRGALLAVQAAYSLLTEFRQAGGQLPPMGEADYQRDLGNLERQELPRIDDGVKHKGVNPQETNYNAWNQLTVYAETAHAVGVMTCA